MHPKVYFFVKFCDFVSGKEEAMGGITGMAKSASHLAVGYESLSQADFKGVLHTLRRHVAQYRSKKNLLQTLAIARHQVTEPAINSRIKKMDAQIAEFKTEREINKEKLPAAREQRLRNNAYTLCAEEIVKTKSRPELQSKIDTVQKSADKKRESTTEITNLVVKRVKAMHDLAGQFDVLREVAVAEDTKLKISKND
jgi:hypothetical protein